MPDIVIHRCVLRIRRLGGWSWGARSEALLAAATRALPTLLASRLPQIDVPPGPGDAVRVTAPVRVRVQARLADLVALAGAHDVDAPEALARAFADRIGQDVASAVAAAIGSGAVVSSEATGHDAGRSEPRDATDVAPPRGSGDAVVDALLRWHADGCLSAMLGSFAPAAVAAWHAALFGGSVPMRTADPALVDRAAAIAARVVAQAQTQAPDSNDVIERLRLRITAAIAISAELRRPPGEPAIRAALHAIVAAPSTDAIAAAVVTSAESDVETASITAATRPVAVARSNVAAPAPAVVGEVHIPSALPFLALVPLSRAGWLGALAAALTASRLTASAPVVAAALAYKLLAPAERGWRRREGVRTAAAALAGSADPVDEAAIHGLARHGSLLAAPLDATVREALRQGHAAGAPLVLHHGARGYLLFDRDGMFLAAVSPDLGDIVAAAARFEAPLLVPAASATPAVLDRLDLANLRFVTDAAPARGEAWRAVPGARLWTNDGAADVTRWAHVAGDLDTAAALAAEIDDEIVIGRPALPLAPESAIERSLTLAAALGLADLSHTLFREREPATPVLALTRFADLDARVIFDGDMVRVRVPLGRRHSDLLRHGYLTAIADVPWLGGRVVEIGGG